MMEPVNKDVKEAVLGADKFLSVTLTQEKLSPSTEKERSLLAEKFKNLITQLGLQSELPARGCNAPPHPPKGGISIPAPVTNGAGQEEEELYDDIAEENVPERPGVKPTPPVPAREDETPPSLAEEKTSYINYANVYQALLDCTADEKEELGFRRGDLIYIYEKPHADWWIGSLFKPQGYSVGLVPKDYVMEAYEFTAA